jgi:hypothetical protein
MKAILIAIALLAALAVAQADVGVVVQFPDGEVYTKCVKVEEDISGGAIMERTTLPLGWHPDWDGFICSIRGIGSCDSWDPTWIFSQMSLGDSSWTESMVGIGAPSVEDCSSIYCSRDGDLIGWAFGTYGSAKPPNIPFEEICPPKAARTRAISRISEPFWKKYCEECGIEYDYTIPPQSLSLMCFNKKREDKERACAAYNLSLSDTGLGFEHPEYLRSINEGLSLGFSYGGRAIVNLTVLVNGQAHFTNETGNIWFEITPSDYLIEVSDDCVGEFKKIIRISA